MRAMRRLLSQRIACPGAISLLIAFAAAPGCEPADEAARHANGETTPGRSADPGEDGIADAGAANEDVPARDGGSADTAMDSAEPDSPQPTAGGAAAAVEIIRAYYRAIDAGDYSRAYHYWAGEGSASRQSSEAFRSGFAETASVQVDTGEPGRIDPAAGSRYIRIPVTITAVTTDGATQRFVGTYTLRRSVVTGATTEQRHWRLYSADIEEV